LSDFNQNSILSTNFRKDAQIPNFMKICSVVAGQREMDRRTEDRNNETNNRFSQFCEGV